jgi:hypothetical protein
MHMLDIDDHQAQVVLGMQVLKVAALQCQQLTDEYKRPWVRSPTACGHHEPQHERPLAALRPPPRRHSVGSNGGVSRVTSAPMWSAMTSGPAPRSICEDVGSYPSGLGRKPVPVRFQLVIDCADPDRLARFWAAALGYELAPAPAGFATWNDIYRELGVPEEELVDGADRISDPEGCGPSIWFHVVPDTKAVKNRLHLDIHASGERTDAIETRRNRVDTEASRLVGLGATISGALSEEGLDHYAVGMKDPEGNEFDIN